MLPDVEMYVTTSVFLSPMSGGIEEVCTSVSWIFAVQTPKSPFPGGFMPFDQPHRKPLSTEQTDWALTLS